jgi:hypothetical protein
METEITRRAFLKTGTAAAATASFHVTPLKSTETGKSQYEAEVRILLIWLNELRFR